MTVVLDFRDRVLVASPVQPWLERERERETGQSRDRID
jgi:hypothetical protein